MCCLVRNHPELVEGRFRAAKAAKVSFDRLCAASRSGADRMTFACYVIGAGNCFLTNPKRPVENSRTGNLAKVSGQILG